MSSPEDSIWGPEPSPEEVEEAYVGMDIAHLRYINGILSQCISVGHLAYTPGNHNDSEMQEAVENHEILGIDMGSGGLFVPTWQFEINQDGLLSIGPPRLYEMWDLWGRGQETLSFCWMMTKPQYTNSNKSRLDLLRIGDKADLNEIRYTMKTHGTDNL
jgi:hypothetical protein